MTSRRYGFSQCEIITRFVILGNHRDAWTFGAVDPNSGTATLLEVLKHLDLVVN